MVMRYVSSVVKLELPKLPQEWLLVTPNTKLTVFGELATCGLLDAARRFIHYSDDGGSEPWTIYS
jgi:hypothetical protein